MELLEITGYLAGLLVAISLVPQVVKSWRTKSTKDISLGWTVIYIAGLLLWVVYSLGIGSWPLFITNNIELALAIFLLAMKLKYG